MSTATDSPVEPSVAATPGVELNGLVDRVLWNLKTSNTCVERRRAQRHPYPYPLRIWTGDACRNAKNGTVDIVGVGTIGMGRHISSGGLDFYSPDPIADRKVVVCFEREGIAPIKVLLELTWCQFGGHGMYLNGGRFLRLLDDNAKIPRQRVAPQQ